MVNFAANIADCEKEPLANSGLVQSNGALMFLSQVDKSFKYVTQNIAEFIGEEPDDLLGADGEEWLELNLPDFTNLPKGAGKRVHGVRALDLGFGDLDVLISPTSSGWIIEFEFSQDAKANLKQHGLIDWQEPLDKAGLDAIQQSLVEQFSHLTGYDRVMLYRFEPDWSGVVLAEKVTQSPGTYLSLRFPASDIPEIARKLYAQTPYRHIPDAVSEPVAILARQGEGTDLDLTWSDLRSVSPVHIEYLKNMNVGSSFSTSIMVQGKLWGLVACHNPEPCVIELNVRQRCKELVEDYVKALLSYRHSVERNLLAKLSSSLNPVNASLKQGQSILDSFESHSGELMGLVDATDVVIVINDDIYPLGSTVLSDDHLSALHSWARQTFSDTVFTTDHLEDVWTNRPAEFPMCGLMGLSVRMKNFGSGNLFVYFLRPEQVTEVAWAGNPEKPLEVTGGNVHISPRKSFERWVQIRKGFSRNWLEEQVFVAQQMQQHMNSWL